MMFIAARAIGEPARAAMLLRMMDGLAHPARELAEAAGVSPSTASEHLNRLVAGGLVTRERSGRLRLHRLASPAVAQAIEALAAISPMLPTENLRDAQRGSRLQFARICYSHLGGALAVTIHRVLAEDGVLPAAGPPRLAPPSRSTTRAHCSTAAPPRPPIPSWWRRSARCWAGRSGSSDRWSMSFAICTMHHVPMPFTCPSIT